MSEDCLSVGDALREIDRQVCKLNIANGGGGGGNRLGVITSLWVKGNILL